MSTAFQAISVVGGVVPPSLLGRVQSGQMRDPKSLQPATYHLIGTETVRDAASRSWMYLKSAWQAWRELDARKRPGDRGPGTGDARQKWLLVMLREFGYGQVPVTNGGFHVGDAAYPISHRWEAVPIHLLGPGVDLDRRNPGMEGASRAPQAMVQEFLNREEEHLWAILSNGLKLRLLRDSTALAGSAYIEFDLETMFDSDLYPEFQILWQLAHQSRLAKRGGPDAPPTDCWLESWRSESIDAGARALDKLGLGVEKALMHLGTGFLRHPDNGWLVDALHSGELSRREFHKALLRTAYRLLFCFVVEDRGALLSPDASTAAQERYATYFSTQRLRKMVRNRDGGPHPDLWRTQKIVFNALGGNGLDAVGLPALGGLFDPDSRAVQLENQPDADLLLGAELANRDYLAAIRKLSWVVGRTERLQPVDYRHLGAEELGSVYESLLELIPRVDTESRTFELVRLSGNERKTTGSYYTPPRLVSALLDTTLDPLLNEAVDCGADAADREARLFAITVCDPASGSGGFLVAAARRIARRLAEVRAGEDEPTPAQIQHALHDVVERCIYGVDMNDLAAELAKVSLWLEAVEPGKPLGFLDARIKIGNSLLGTTPALLANGVPDEAFGVIEGDDKKVSAEVKKRNKVERRGQEAFSFGAPTASVAQLIDRRQELVQPVASVEDARSRAKAYEAFDHSTEMEQKRLHADAWCAAFVWPLKAGEPEPPTSSVVRQLGDSGEPAGFTETVTKIRELSREYRFFHWHLEFPEVFGDPDAGENGAEGWPDGFSCMLGNPPWERVKLQEKEFFAARSPEIANATNASIRRRKIAALEMDPIQSFLFEEYIAERRRRERQSKFLRLSGRYPLGGRGDVNTYVVFAELFYQGIASHGSAGIIVKTGIATDENTSLLFQDFVRSKRICSLFDFENTKMGGGRFFEGAHPAEKFCLLTLVGRSRSSQDVSLAFFLDDPNQVEERAFTLNASNVLLMNPRSGTLPVFRSPSDALLTASIYQRMPILAPAVSQVWPGLKMSRMLDVTNDSRHFHTGEEWAQCGYELDSQGIFSKEDHVARPLYEGKMINLWDHRAADVVWSATAGHRQRQPSYLSDSDKADPSRFAHPAYWVSQDVVPPTPGGWHIGFSLVTSPQNQRTFICTAVPVAGMASSLPILYVEVEGRLKACLLAMLSSFVFDYVARQKVGGVNMSFFILEQLPVKPPGFFEEPCPWNTDSTIEEWLAPRILELTYSSHDLDAIAGDFSAPSRPYVWNRSRRAEVTAELDAAFFHFYGLSRSEVEYVMETFSALKKRELTLFAEFRTKQRILEAFDAMGRATEQAFPFTSTLNPPPGQGPRHPAREASA